MKRRFWGKVLPTFCIISLVACLYPLSASALEAKTVTVTGHGTVLASADSAEIGFSLEGRGASPDEATQEAAKRWKTISKAAGALGTLRLESHCTYKDCTTGDYCVSRYYTLTTDKPSEAPSMAERLITSGASCVNPPLYLLKDRTEWEKKALTVAMADAEARAAICGAGGSLSVLFDQGNDLFFCYGNADGTVTVSCTVTLTYHR